MVPASSTIVSLFCMKLMAADNYGMSLLSGFLNQMVLWQMHVRTRYLVVAALGMH